MPLPFTDLRSGDRCPLCELVGRLTLLRVRTSRRQPPWVIQFLECRVHGLVFRRRVEAEKIRTRRR